MLFKVIVLKKKHIKKLYNKDHTYFVLNNLNTIVIAKYITKTFMLFNAITKLQTTNDYNENL